MSTTLHDNNNIDDDGTPEQQNLVENHQDPMNNAQNTDSPVGSTNSATTNTNTNFSTGPPALPYPYPFYQYPSPYYPLQNHGPVSPNNHPNPNSKTVSGSEETHDPQQNPNFYPPNQINSMHPFCFLPVMMMPIPFPFGYPSGTYPSMQPQPQMQMQPPPNMNFQPTYQPQWLSNQHQYQQPPMPMHNHVHFSNHHQQNTSQPLEEQVYISNNSQQQYGPSESKKVHTPRKKTFGLSFLKKKSTSHEENKDYPVNQKSKSRPVDFDVIPINEKTLPVSNHILSPQKQKHVSISENIQTSDITTDNTTTTDLYALSTSKLELGPVQETLLELDSESQPQDQNTPLSETGEISTTVPTLLLDTDKEQVSDLQPPPLLSSMSNIPTLDSAMSPSFSNFGDFSPPQQNPIQSTNNQISEIPIPPPLISLNFKTLPDQTDSVPSPSHVETTKLEFNHLDVIKSNPLQSSSSITSFTKLYQNHSQSDSDSDGFLDSFSQTPLQLDPLPKPPVAPPPIPIQQPEPEPDVHPSSTNTLRFPEPTESSISKSSHLDLASPSFDPTKLSPNQLSNLVDFLASQGILKEIVPVSNRIANPIVSESVPGPDLIPPLMLSGRTIDSILSPRMETKTKKLLKAESQTFLNNQQLNGTGTVIKTPASVSVPKETKEIVSEQSAEQSRLDITVKAGKAKAKAKPQLQPPPLLSSSSLGVVPRAREKDGTVNTNTKLEASKGKNSSIHLPAPPVTILPNLPVPELPPALDVDFLLEKLKNAQFLARQLADQLKANDIKPQSNLNELPLDTKSLIEIQMEAKAKEKAKTAAMSKSQDSSESNIPPTDSNALGAPSDLPTVNDPHLETLSDLIIDAPGKRIKRIRHPPSIPWDLLDKNNVQSVFGSNFSNEEIQKIKRYLHGWIFKRRFRMDTITLLNSTNCKKLRQRNSITLEIRDSEVAYNSFLRIIESMFVPKMYFLSSKHFETLFGNFRPILLLSNLFLAKLNSQYEKWPVVNIGQIFSNVVPFFSSYHDYVSAFATMSETLKDLRQNSHETKFNSIISKLEIEAAEALDKKPISLESYLIMPVQRLPRYILLVRELLKFTPPYHTDYQPLLEAYSLLTESTQKVNLQTWIREIKLQREAIASAHYNMADVDENGITPKGSEISGSGLGAGLGSPSGSGSVSGSGSGSSIYNHWSRFCYQPWRFFLGSIQNVYWIKQQPLSTSSASSAEPITISIPVNVLLFVDSIFLVERPSSSKFKKKLLKSKSLSNKIIAYYNLANTRHALSKTTKTLHLSHNPSAVVTSLYGLEDTQKNRQRFHIRTIEKALKNWEKQLISHLKSSAAGFDPVTNIHCLQQRFLVVPMPKVLQSWINSIYSISPLEFFVNLAAEIRPSQISLKYDSRSWSLPKISPIGSTLVVSGPGIGDAPIWNPLISWLSNTFSVSKKHAEILSRCLYRCYLLNLESPQQSDVTSLDISPIGPNALSGSGTGASVAPTDDSFSATTSHRIDEFPSLRVRDIQISFQDSNDDSFALAISAITRTYKFWNRVLTIYDIGKIHSRTVHFSDICQIPGIKSVYDNCVRFLTQQLE